MLRKVWGKKKTPTGEVRANLEKRKVTYQPIPQVAVPPVTAIVPVPNGTEEIPI